MTPLERAATYGAFAAAFRSPDGGAVELNPALVPPPPENAERLFMACFDPAVSKQAVSLHASAHANREQTDLFQELIRWYDHFGLKRRDGGELPDHVSVMLEFMQFLCTSEDSNASDVDALASLHAAQADFLTRHLVLLASSLAGKVHLGTNRYARLPAALQSFLEDELDALDSA